MNIKGPIVVEVGKIMLDMHELGIMCPFDQVFDIPRRPIAHIRRDDPHSALLGKFGHEKATIVGNAIPLLKPGSDVGYQMEEDSALLRLAKIICTDPAPPVAVSPQTRLDPIKSTAFRVILGMNFKTYYWARVKTLELFHVLQNVDFTSLYIHKNKIRLELLLRQKARQPNGIRCIAQHDKARNNICTRIEPEVFAKHFKIGAVPLYSQNLPRRPYGIGNDVRKISITTPYLHYDLPRANKGF